MTDLSKYEETYKRETVILSQLQRHVMRKSVEKDEDRSDTVIHPSDLVHGAWCSRSIYYRITGEDAMPVPFSFRTMNIFAEGNDIHDKYQRWLHEMGILWGSYRCRDCGFVTHRTFGAACKSCGSVRLKYAEVKLRDDARMIQGSTDGVIVTEGKARLLEIKSIGLGSIRIENPVLYDKFISENRDLAWLWMNISAPFPSHLRQGMMYLALTNTSEDIGTHIDEIIFLYEYKPTQEVKEFSVKFNETILGNRLEEAEKLSNVIRSGGDAPDRPLWAETSNKKCKECSYKSVCWKEETVVNKPAKPRVKRATATRRRKALGR